MADVKEDGPTSPDVHFEPIVKLAPVEIKTLEENEEEVFRIRAKLFRYFKNAETTEWKERGVGDIKILKSNDDSKYRIVMRRDKTFKLCANHYLLPTMELKANCDSDRAFVWNTPADFADEEPKAETLAIRFANAENAKKFKTAFEDCQQSLSNAEEKKDKEKPAEEEKPAGDADTVAEKLGEMTVKDGNKGDEPNNDTSKVQNGDSNVSSKDETEEKEK